jgi:hypothetical protein
VFPASADASFGSVWLLGDEVVTFVGEFATAGVVKGRGGVLIVGLTKVERDAGSTRSQRF